MSSGSAVREKAVRHRGLVLDLPLALDLLVKHVKLVVVVAINHPEERTTESEAQQETGHQAALTRNMVRILVDYLETKLIEFLGDGIDVVQLLAPRLSPRHA